LSKEKNPQKSITGDANKPFFSQAPIEPQYGLVLSYLQHHVHGSFPFNDFNKGNEKGAHKQS